MIIADHRDDDTASPVLHSRPFRILIWLSFPTTDIEGYAAIAFDRVGIRWECCAVLFVMHLISSHVRYLRSWPDRFGPCPQVSNLGGNPLVCDNRPAILYQMPVCRVCLRQIAERN